MLAVLIAIGVAIVVFRSAFRSATTTMVVLVGPVEKDVGTIHDPPLSTEGEERAQRLARMFGEGPGVGRLNAVYVSETRLAQQTAAPLAERLGIHPTVVPMKDAKDTVDTVLREHEGGTVMLIATSATVPQLLRAFGGRDLAPSKDDDYDTAFVVSIPTFGDSSVLRLKY
jgi:broad specificity phosphatase PhoE